MRRLFEVRFAMEKRLTHRVFVKEGSLMRFGKCAFVLACAMLAVAAGGAWAAEVVNAAVDRKSVV